MGFGVVFEDDERGGPPVVEEGGPAIGWRQGPESQKPETRLPLGR